jgi:hypothetical protein
MPFALDGLSEILTVYQETVRYILDQSDHPGISAQELELFKSQFRASAYTCRLKSCPRATLGFESETLCVEHELTHVQKFRCVSPDCHFPPFVSAQALKSHVNRYHNPNPAPKPIRNIQIPSGPRRIPTLRDEKAINTDTQNHNSTDAQGNPTISLSTSGELNAVGVEKTDGSDIREKAHTLPTTGLNATGDEYIPSETDEFGEKKVMPNGVILGNREYQCRTFLLPNRGDKLFMLAAECARVLKYRESYLLFNKNKSLYKIIASQAEKDDLIQQEILPFSYRSRQMAVVTARSMFRQFGSRIIVNGRRVRDDYWETKAREQGFTEADLAGEKRPKVAKAKKAAQRKNAATRWLHF